ncbi:hypothetical protein [Cerasicoccus maritimus]|uniref:hypothetical protein n=1 Tax=Cerasicoccus maritimus TaxID=490089 RepID=UPI002852968A|nr:hypothetical protein [Cerasicoccus maritimus]
MLLIVMKVFGRLFTELLVCCMSIATYAEDVYKPIVINAPAEFAPTGSETGDLPRMLTLPFGEQILWIQWDTPDEYGDFEYFPKNIQEGEVYSFHLVWEKETHPSLFSSVSEKDKKDYLAKGVPEYCFDGMEPVITKILSNDVVVYERGVCEVHGRPMQIIDAEIEYGLPLGEEFEPDWKLLANSFPHYKKRVLGGCVVMPEKTRRIYYCPECGTAHARWLKGMKAGKSTGTP